MRKILFMLALMCAVMSANAQIATENSKALDNIGLGVTVGASTPLDFNSVFPLNANVGLKLQKDFTPIVGLQLEGLAILNDNHFNDLKTAVKATNVGLNGVINLTNLFKGYNGTPRFFEVSTVTGLGWLYTWDTSINNLSSKTGLDFAFNLGKNKAHSLVVTPAVYWNLNKFSHIHFDKRGSQLALNLSYVYHFATSNGTHHFKTYDVGAMMNEITRLNGALEECEKREPQVVEKNVRVVIPRLVPSEVVVQFAKNSYELTSEATTALDAIGNDVCVDVVGLASPEGDGEYNQRLSERRAAAVADYLAKRGVEVKTFEGRGVENGDATNRLAKVKVSRKDRR